MRQKGRKVERDGRWRTDGEADTINFVPISELGFVPSEASLSSAPRSNIQLTPTFPPVFFRARHWVFHALVRHSRVPTTKRRELQSAKWFIGAGRAALQGEENGLHLGQNFLAEQRFAAVRYRYVFLANSGSGRGAGGGPRVLPTYPPSYSYS